MSRIKRADIISLVLMICIPVPCFFYFALRFYTGFEKSNITGQNICLIIAAAFVWGMADIVRHYISILRENDSLERFSIKFSADENADLSSEFKGSIINHRYNIILSLRNSISDIRHETLSEIISSKESGRAVMARYFIGACVMLGLLGSFLGLLKTVGGAYSAIESVSNSTQLLTNLHSPLSGMSLTFSTSIIGIIASLSLGFAFIFLNRKQMTFLADLEEFTQTALIPKLSISSGKRIEDLLERLVKIEENTGAFVSMKAEIGSEAKRMISSIDGYYSRLSDSILERMESSMLSLENNISDSFASLSDSTSLSIKSLNSSVDSSVKDMTSDLQSGLKEFLAGEMSIVQEFAGKVGESTREGISSNIESVEKLYGVVTSAFEEERTQIKMLQDAVGDMILSSRETIIDQQKSAAQDLNSFLHEEKSMISSLLEDLSTRGQQGIKEAHSLMESHSEKSMEQMAGLLASNMDAYRDSVDSFMEKWSTVLESRMDTSVKEMQENTNRVYKDALDRNESIISQNLDLFEKTTKEFHELGTGLKQMHEVYRERLDQTAQVIDQAVRGFRDMLEKEHETNEDLSEKNIKAGELLEEVAVLLQSNQAEMSASLSMFVQGIDSLLQGFQVKAGEKDEEQTLVQNLEKSLNELTEKSGSVLSEYVARSREIYSGLLENQLHLTRKIEEMTGGKN